MPDAAIQRNFSVPGLPEPPGPYAWTTACGEMLFVSGLRGIDPATGFPAPTDEDRIRLIFEHLARALEAAGSSLRHVLSTRVYVTDMRRHRPIVNEAYERFFGADLPTRTIVEVHALNQNDTIELEAVAARNLAMNVAVLDDYQRVARDFADWDSLGPDVSVQFFHDHVKSEDELADRLQPFEILAIMRERTSFPRTLIERLPNLKLLVTTGKRNASVDVAACKARGITVCGTAGSEGSTIELAWGLIIAVVRGIPREDRGLREGRWQIKVGMELRGKTLGVLGLGRLGSQSAQIGGAFGMNVIAWSQNLTEERAKSVGAELVAKRALFERSDVITIHLVLSDRTRGIVGRDELARMKKTAYLVNTSRGPIVDENALVAALESDQIAGAGLDVYSQEPLPPDDPILQAPNTVLTPHIGYVADESYKAFYRETVEDIAAWLSGKPIRVIE